MLRPFLHQVFFSEKAAEAGGTMDVDDCQTEEEMNKKMETYDKLLLVSISTIFYTSLFRAFL